MVVAAAALLALVLVAASGCGSSSQTLKPIGAGLEGVRNLHATIYARGIPQMSAFALDARNRLWVARSGSSNHASDGVYLVPREGAKPLKVISSIRGPLGLVWIGKFLYVSSLDGVTRYGGLTGARFTQRTTILLGPVNGAENNNLVLAPNGRLVLAVSAPCDHCTTAPRYSASIVSFKPDGSDLRVVASGIRAAYGLVYRGETLYASMNQRDDLGSKTPGDWVAIIRDGQDWGFPACYGQGGTECAGVPSPLGVLDAHAAAGGLAVVGRSVVTAEWMDGAVLQVGLGGGAATPLLKGLSHPLPLLTSSDGSLLVGDWGTGVVYRVSGAA